MSIKEANSGTAKQIAQLKPVPGLTPRELNGKKVTKCKDCPYWYYKLKDSKDSFYSKAPHCKLNGRYIIKMYQDQIITWCKLPAYKELPKIRDRFKNLIFEENDNASNKKGT